MLTAKITRLATIAAAALLLAACAQEQQPGAQTSATATVTPTAAAAKQPASSASPNKTPQPTHNYHRYMDEPVTRGSREHVDGLTSAIVEVRGQIQLPDGAPASSATVELVHHAPGIDRSRVVETTQTEASGNYVIRGEDHRELALRVSGDFPTAYIQLKPEGTYFSGQPGLRKLERDITLQQSHKITGSTVDAAGNPISGVPVHLLPSFKRTPNENLLDERPREIRKTTSTAEGTFEFDHLSQGPWIVGAKADQLAPVSILADVPTTGPVEIRLASRGGTVQGRVLHRTTNDPVGGMLVNLGSGDMNQLPDLESQQLITSADGSFRFDHLSTGPLRVYAQATSQSLYMALPRPGNITLSEGETQDVDIYVYPGHTIEGRITDADTGAPLPGATVETWSLATRGNITAVSGNDGNYRLEPVVPYDQLEVWLTAKLDAYALKTNSSHHENASRVRLTGDGTPVRHDLQMTQKIALKGKVVTTDEAPVGHAMVRFIGTSTELDEEKSVSADGSFTLYAAPFTAGSIQATAKGFTMAILPGISVTNQEIDNLKVVMKPGATVTGTVIDSDGNPIEGAEVKADKVFENFTFVGTGKITDADGTFQITDLSEHVKLSARKEGYEPSDTLDLSLQPAEIRNDIRLILNAQENHTISGIAVKTDGSPVPGVWLRLKAQPSKSAVSKSDGSFVLTGLKQGSHDIQIHAPSSRDRVIHSVKAGTADLRVIIPDPPQPQSRGTVTLSGTVIDDITEDPVPNFTVTAPRLQVTKDQQPGKFTITGLPARSKYPVTISSPEHEAQIFYADAGSDGEVIEQTFRLGKPGVLTGRLVDEMSGQPIPDISVVFRRDEIRSHLIGEIAGDTVTADDGTFTLANVPNGDNRLTFLLHPPYAELTMDVKVKSGEVTDLGDVKAGSGGSIFGQVVRGSGKEPVEGAEVMVRSVTGSLGFEKTLSTNSEGKFDIIGLKDARYEIKTANRRLSREIRDSNVVDLVIELGAVQVTGMVTLGGKPYRGWVHYRSGDEESLVHTEQGRYTIDGLKPGQYEVEVSLESGIRHKESVTVPDQREFEKDIALPDGRIKVSLIDEAGNPVPGITIELSGDPLASSGKYSLTSDPTSPEGTCTFTGLAPGTYTVTVGTTTQRGQGIQEVQIVDGETKELRVQTRKIQ